MRMYLYFVVYCAGSWPRKRHILYKIRAPCASSAGYIANDKFFVVHYIACGVECRFKRLRTGTMGNGYFRFLVVPLITVIENTNTNNPR